MRASRQLSRFLRPYRVWVILAPTLMALEVAMDLMQPRLVQHIIDQGILLRDFPLVVRTGLWMIGLSLIGTLGGMGCGVFAVRTGQAFGADLRHALFEHIQSLSFGNLDTWETGSLITRLTNDVDQVQNLVMTMLRIMVRAPLLLLGGLIMGILASPRLAVLFLVLIPVVVVVLIGIVQKTSPLFSQVQRRLDTLNTVLQENLAGVRVVKAFARGDYEQQRFGQANEALMDRNIRAVRWSALTSPLLLLTLNMGIVAVVWLGGVHVKAGTLQVGQVVAFINYLSLTLMSLMAVSMILMQVTRAEASALRVQEVMESRPQIPSAPEARTFHAPRGRVVFDNVSFRYDRDEHDPVLKNISFVAEPGQTVALLGATGAGKSSLVQLIPRFYDVTGGRVTIDGTDVRSMSEDALREQVGIALQEAILFSGTIRDNIRYGRPEATDAQVRAATQAAQADEFIHRLPQGYDSVVGQRGVNLSGGQKQRLAIARALLTQPAVLILDDSTSAVDVRTEARIHEALATEYAGQTRVIVAQRISTVQNADKIVILDDGAIVAEGTHEALLRSSPVYREITKSQQESQKVTQGSD